MGDSKSGSDSPSRRNFLKIGAGVVAGAVVAGVGVAAYESSVIGSNNNSSSSTVASLQNQLTATQSQLDSAVNSLNNANSSLNNANSTISNLNGQLSTVQGSLTAANSQNATLNSQLTATQSSLSSASNQVSTLQSQLSTTQSQLSTAQTQLSSAQQQGDQLSTQLESLYSFETLNPKEAAQVNAIADTMIPSDSNGPGGVEAGVVYFIDRQLVGSYGRAGNMYMQGPFIQPNQKTPVTVGGITYPNGTTTTRISSGIGYQYAMTLREFWRRGLLFLDAYSTSAYGGAFETLTIDKRTQILNDLFDNKPTTFAGPTPVEFVYELHDMVVAGFYSDPIHGGNRNMIGWKLNGSGGVNSGSFDGLSSRDLMVASKPTRLTPISLGQLRVAAEGGS